MDHTVTPSRMIPLWHRGHHEWVIFIFWLIFIRHFIDNISAVERLKIGAKIVVEEVIELWLIIIATEAYQKILTQFDSQPFFIDPREVIRGIDLSPRHLMMNLISFDQLKAWIRNYSQLTSLCSDLSSKVYGVVYFIFHNRCFRVVPFITVHYVVCLLLWTVKRPSFRCLNALKLPFTSLMSWLTKFICNKRAHSFSEIWNRLNVALEKSSLSYSWSTHRISQSRKHREHAFLGLLATFSFSKWCPTNLTSDFDLCLVHVWKFH